jgi:hypothetical protein
VEYALWPTRTADADSHQDVARFSLKAVTTSSAAWKYS